MQTRLLIAASVVSIASASLGAGFVAFFSDQGSAAGNLFDAGTLDLTLNGAESIGAFVGSPNMKPGDGFTGAVELRNAGSIVGSGVDLDITVDLDSARGADGVGRLASFLRLNAVEYGTSSALNIPDVNGNGFPDLEDWDLSNAGSRDIFDPEGGAYLSVSFTFDESAGNQLQGDVVTANFHFQLAQTNAPDLVQNPPATLGMWSTLNPMPFARSGPFGAILDGTFYVAGGHGGASDTPTLQAFNTATNTWTQKANMPAGRYSGQATGVIDGKLYVAGGWTSSPGLPHSEMWAYDPGTNAWTAKASLPMLSACGGGAVINGQFYVTTACDGYSGYRNFLHRYNPATNAWTQLAGSPQAHGGGAVEEINGKLYVAGGNTFAGSPGASLDVYDPAANTWTTLAPMPAVRSAVASAVLGGKMYVFGGSDGTQGVATTFVYDPATNSWSSETSMPNARYDLIADSYDGVIYVAGGNLADVRSAQLTAFMP